ncbi:MAG: alanine--glyoxylate aminotransferase family protein [Gemmatimonadota bacterium]|nr:alanine--glyoxylate aminotransferase family protein [Gemmatimonadota bacterium]
MTPPPTFGTFFLPGPTDVRPEILAAMMRPMIGHRAAAFEEMFARIQAGLRHVFRTKRPVYVSSSSATGMMEASIRSAPAGPILSLVNGAFSERYARIAAACARATDVLEVPLGQTFRLGEVEARLAEKHYAAVTVVHSETSTGVLTDVHAVSDLAHRYGVMCLVDSVTGVAGVPVEFDAWGMDFVLTGSQKALALPPGLAFAAASAEYVEHAKATSDRGTYFDIVEFEKFASKHQTPNTPAISLLYALEAQLESIVTESIERRWARHEAMRAETERWVASCANRLGIGMFAPEGARSPTVSTITLPEGVTAGAMVKAVAARGYTIGGGYGKVGERAVRIGHMGDHTLETLGRCLEACADALRELAGNRSRL